MDPGTSSKIFSLNTILSLAKNKDPNVRRVAVQMMAQKCEKKPRHLWVLVQMWTDKHSKVRKEVMEVLGDIGKRHPSYIPLIMETIDTESVSSILVWRHLSLSWGILICSNVDREEYDYQPFLNFKQTQLKKSQSNKCHHWFGYLWRFEKTKIRQAPKFWKLENLHCSSITLQQLDNEQVVYFTRVKIQGVTKKCLKSSTVTTI